MRVNKKEKQYIANLIQTDNLSQTQINNWIDTEIRRFESEVGTSIKRVEEFIEATEALKQNPNGPDFENIKSLRLKVQKSYLKSLKVEAKND